MNLSESYKKRITELAGIAQAITFENSFVGYHHGQQDAVLTVFYNGVNAGGVSYSLFDGKTHIDYIQIKPEFRKQGLAEKLIDYLAKEYGYENLDWGMTTEDGTALMKKMDSKYNFDRTKITSPQFDAKTVLKIISEKSKTAEIFMNDLIHLGASATFEKWRGKIAYDNLIDNIDVNDLSDIASWTIGSKDNNNPSDYEPPDYVIGLLNHIKNGSEAID